MRIAFFGTFDEARHPRVRVLREGLAAHGHEIVVVNVPIRLDTSARVDLVRRPWTAPVAALSLLRCWVRLLRAARSVTAADAVVVGYLGHLDVHLARRRWPNATIVLDHMVSLADTARDRGLDRRRWLIRLLAAVDRAALRAADVVVVDTVEHAALAGASSTVVVPVGAPADWFDVARDERASGDPLRVVFFGLFTPLQGAPVIGRAAAALVGEPVQWTLIGTGQEHEATRRAAGAAPIDWLDWIDAAQLPKVVAAHDVCLGIFGEGEKAHRVVPNKVYQGAAAGCAVITSDTQPQRDVLGDTVLYVPPGDADALASTIRLLAHAPEDLREYRRRAREHAAVAFTPAAVTAGLHDVLASTTPHVAAVATTGLPPLTLSASLRWDVVERLLADLSPRSICEVGAGQGAVGVRLARRTDRYVAVEPDPTSSATAAARLGTTGRVVSDLRAIDPDERFDLVCAFEVLEHIADDRSALAEWAQRLTADGHLLLSVPADPSRYGPMDELVGHHRRYDERDLAAVLDRAGLELVTIRRYGAGLGDVLEAGRNVIARRRLRTDRAPVDIDDRSAASGRLLQPPAWAGGAIRVASAPFRAAQHRMPGRGPGLVALARPR